MSSAVHCLWGAPVLKVCVMSVFTLSKMSGRSTVPYWCIWCARQRSYPFLCTVVSGQGPYHVWVSRLAQAVCSEQVLGGGSLLSWSIWLISSAWLRQVIRQTNEDWGQSRCEVSSNAPKQCGTPRGLSRLARGWNGQDVWKTGGRGSSHTSDSSAGLQGGPRQRVQYESQHVGLAEDVSRTLSALYKQCCELGPLVGKVNPHVHVQRNSLRQSVELSDYHQ